MPDWTERYRFEGRVPCIDIRVKNIEQLFDNRDPAPFHERDLDDDAVEYLVDAADEIPLAAGPFKIVVWTADPLPASLPIERVVAAFGNHFANALQRLRRSIRTQARQSRLFAVLGVLALGILLGLAELTAGLRSSPVGHVVPEGFTILAWVMLWRPLEALVYDWVPRRDERRRLERIGAAVVEVRRATAPM